MKPERYQASRHLGIEIVRDLVEGRTLTAAEIAIRLNHGEKLFRDRVAESVRHREARGVSDREA